VRSAAVQLVANYDKVATALGGVAAAVGFAWLSFKGLEAKVEKVDKVEAKLDKVEVELKAELNTVKVELGAKLDTVEVELKAELNTVKVEMGTMKGQLGKVDAKLDKLLNRSWWGFLAS
jgi:hypothetical protein